MRLHAALISFLATAGIVVHSQAANQEENPSQQVEMPRFAVIIPITDVFIAGKSRRATMSTEASKEIIHRKLAEALCQLPDKVCRKTVDSETIVYDVLHQRKSYVFRICKESEAIDVVVCETIEFDEAIDVSAEDRISLQKARSEFQNATDAKLESVTISRTYSAMNLAQLENLYPELYGLFTQFEMETGK